MKRTADFSLKPLESSHILQSKPLPLPKRSKLFLEQSIRERQNALGKFINFYIRSIEKRNLCLPEIHQTFQQDLIRLRLAATRNLVQNLNDQSGVGNEKEQIKLSAQVLKFSINYFCFSLMFCRF